MIRSPPPSGGERLHAVSVDCGRLQTGRKQPTISWWTAGGLLCWAAGVGLLAWWWRLMWGYWNTSHLFDAVSWWEADHYRVKLYAQSCALLGTLLGFIGLRRGKLAIGILVFMLNALLLTLSAWMCFFVVRE